MGMTGTRRILECDDMGTDIVGVLRAWKQMSRDPQQRWKQMLGYSRGDVKRNAEIKTHFTVMLLLLGLL